LLVVGAFGVDAFSDFAGADFVSLDLDSLDFLSPEVESLLLEVESLLDSDLLSLLAVLDRCDEGLSVL